MKLQVPLLYENDFNMLADILQELQDSGAIVNNSTKTSVVIDTAGVESKDKFIENLLNIENSKGELLAKSLGLKNHEITNLNNYHPKGIVSFPIFKSSFDKNDIQSYIQLSQGITNYADKANSISNKPNPSTNDKFVFRTWLIRFGMVGEEYKHARKLFSKDLQGDSAWFKNVDIEGTDSFIEAETIQQDEVELDETVEQGMQLC